MNRWHAAVLLTCLAAAPYLTTAHFGFVYDDRLWVHENPAARDLGKLPLFFAGHEWFRPLTVFSLRLDYALAGLRPFWYHVHNVLLHALATALVYAIFRRFDERKAIIAAALFAVIPVHSEAVANIASRSELLAAVFGLAALTQVARPALAGALLLFALAAKESAVAVPALALLLWWRSPQRPPRRLVLATLSAFAVAIVAYGALRLWLHGAPGLSETSLYNVDNPLVAAGWAGRVRTAVVLLAQNLLICLVPYHLSADYSYAEVIPLSSWLDFPFLLWTSALAGALAAATTIRRTRPNVLRGLAWFCIGALPVSNLLFPIGTIRAERLLYVPSAGVCLLGAEALALLIERRVRFAAALAVVLIVSLGEMAVKRTFIWQDEESLFTAMVADAPRSAKAHFELGGYRLRTDNCVAALPSFRRALEIYPNFLMAQIGQAACLEVIGDTAAAKSLYRDLLDANPSYGDAAEALMKLCASHADWHCVAGTVRRIIVADPKAAADPRAWIALGTALRQTGDSDGAAEAWKKARALGGRPPD